MASKLTKILGIGVTVLALTELGCIQRKNVEPGPVEIWPKTSYYLSSADKDGDGIPESVMRIKETIAKDKTILKSETREYFFDSNGRYVNTLIRLTEYDRENPGEVKIAEDTLKGKSYKEISEELQNN